MKGKALLLVALVCGLMSLLSGTVSGDEVPAAISAVSAEELETSELTVGEIGLALNVLGGDRDSSKFEEYREVPSGLYLNTFGLTTNNRTGTRRLNIRGSNIGLLDQAVEVVVDKFGHYSLELNYNKIPHLYSNTARTIFQDEKRNVFTLPDQLQTDLQTIAETDPLDAVAFGEIIDGLARPVRLRVDRRKIGVRSDYAVSPSLSIYARYSDERRTGRKPLVARIAAINELPQVVDDKTQDLVIGTEYVGGHGAARLEFNQNSYRNDINSVIWDNPIRDSDELIGLGTRSEPEKSRIGAPPDNTARNVNLSGAYRFGDSVRLTGIFSRGQWRQDEEFVPMTINQEIINAYPDIVALPSSNLDGEIDTSLYQVAVNIDAGRSLRLTTRYRRYELDNNTDHLEFAGIISRDRSVDTEPVESHAHSYTKKNTGVDVAWRPSRRVNLNITGEREEWERVNRDVDETREDIFRASLDYRATDWLLVRLSELRGKRRIRGEYDAGEEEFSELRRFDVADRDREKETVMLHFTPNERFDASLVLLRLDDEYPKTDFGLIREDMRDISLDWSYDVSEITSLYGGASYNETDLDMASRYRQEDPLDNWSSRQRDDSRAFWLGVNHVLKPGKLMLDVSVDYNIDRSKTDTNGVAGGSSSGDPTDWPTQRFRYFAPALTLDYLKSDDQVWRFSYRYERFSQQDFQYDIMMPYIGLIDSGADDYVFLGARAPSYRAHILTLELIQRF